MKTILIFLLLIPFAVVSQTFEGTIVWSVKTDGVDPETTAKMEKAKKEMNDPANQEKLKQLEAQMNSPEFKAMMEKNPQLKTQMEAARKALTSGNIGSMMPENMTLKIKGNSSLMIIQGGIAASEILTIGSKEQTYRIDRTAKTYSLVSAPGTTVRNDTKDKYKVTKTAETMKILGYDCTKYIVTSETASQTMNHVMWTTTALKGLDPKTFNRQQNGNGQSFYFDGMEGFPLRMEMDASKMKIIFEVTSLKKENLPSTDFEIPAGFTETNVIR